MYIPVGEVLTYIDQKEIFPKANRYLQFGLFAIGTLLAGCSDMPSSLSAQPAAVLSESEATCNGTVTDPTIIEARKQDAINIARIRESIEEAKELMAISCPVPPPNN